jgi:uncharacterized protein
LIVACQNRQVQAARALLAAGANANDVDDDGTPVLHWAVFGERPEELHLYFELGGPHDTEFIQRKTAPLVKLLLAKGATLEAVDRDGNTALHHAAMMDAVAAVKLLLAAGAKRSRPNREGKTAYMLAKERESAAASILQ